jgi:hypothetical protein
MLITSFGDGAGSKLKAVKQLPFEVTVNRVVTRTLSGEPHLVHEQGIRYWRHHGFYSVLFCVTNSPISPEELYQRSEDLDSGCHPHEEALNEFATSGHSWFSRKLAESLDLR